MPWRFSRASAPVLAALVAGSALAQPMGSSLPGPGPGPAPVPGSSIGSDAPTTRTRELSAEKCAKLPDDQREACLRSARREGPEGSTPSAGATRERGTVDRVGPGSTGMGSGAPR